jgi:hypothetical protein
VGSVVGVVHVPEYVTPGSASSASERLRTSKLSTWTFAPLEDSFFRPVTTTWIVWLPTLGQLFSKSGAWYTSGPLKPKVSTRAEYVPST